MFENVTTVQETKSIEKNGKQFNVAMRWGPEGAWNSFLYQTQRIFSPAKRRLYRFYNRSPARFWNSVAAHEWENETFRIFETYLDERHSFIDIGAWIGPTVLFGSQLAKHCYAIEPDPVAYKLLTANIALNPTIAPKITTVNQCISSNCGKVNLGRASFTGGDSRSSLLFNEGPQWHVEATTLQKLINHYQIMDCNFIKMDIEGGEVIVLPAIAEFLHRVKPTLFLSIHSMLFPNPEEDKKKILDVLSPYAYIFDAQGRMIPQKLLENLEIDCLIATDRL